MTTQFYMHSDEEIPEDERHPVTAPRQRNISDMQLPSVNVVPLLNPIPLMHHALPSLRDKIFPS